MSDVTGKVPMFGYPLLSFENEGEERNESNCWKKITSSILNPNANILAKELLLEYYKY